VIPPGCIEWGPRDAAAKPFKKPLQQDGLELAFDGLDLCFAAKIARERKTSTPLSRDAIAARFLNPQFELRDLRDSGVKKIINKGVTLKGERPDKVSLCSR
jgi:ATP-dependent protease Clp ATPase subunit